MTNPRDDLSARFDNLEHEITRTRNQNRILKIVLCLLPCLALLLGAGEDSTNHSDKITTKSLVIQDDDGHTCLTLGSEKGRGFVLVHDSQERVRIGLGLGTDEIAKPGLGLTNAEGKALLEMGITEKHGPRFRMVGDNTAGSFFVVGMAIENGVPFYQLMDENGKMIRGVGGRAIER